MVERKERTPKEIASLPHVVSVRALEDYELEVTFENGECRRFDVKPYLGRGIFVRLRDRELFQAVRAVAGSIEWPGGLDLSYETLYLDGGPIDEPAPGSEPSVLNELVKRASDMPEVDLPGVELGRLETEDPRKIWPHEERDFTPWLAANIGQLSEVMGIPLSVQKVEQRVGNYQLDIYALDENSESVVIIENQLEETDHKHLGQLMAYAAGLNAKVIIWIATAVRDEHRLVIDWLNRNMGDDVSFFLVRLKVVHIEDSKRAVQFIPEAQPSQFERTLDSIVARTPAIRPTRMVWSDLPDNPASVTSWRAVLRSTLERAIQDTVRLESLPLRTTNNADEAEGYAARVYFEQQQVYVDINGNASWTKGKVKQVLRSMGKPDGFLRIECDDGTVVSLPGQP